MGDSSEQRWPARWMPAVLDRWAEKQGDRVAFTFLEAGEEECARLSYGELRARGLGVARELRARRLAGRPVLLPFGPGLEFVVGFFGCLYAGALAVPCNLPARARQLPRLRGIWQDCEPAAVLSDSDGLTRLERVVRAEPPAGWDSVPKLATDQTQATHDAAPFEPAADDVAFLQYTSGSTSEPKGVVVTHGNLLHNEEMIRLAFGQDRESVVVGWLPMHHDMGLIGNVLQPLYVGARCVLMPPAAFLQKPARWLAAITKYSATTSGGPNFAFDLCARRVTEDERAGLDLSSWRVAFNGAEPVRADTLERFAAAFAGRGFDARSFYPCYGLAEATLFVSGGERGAGAHVRSLSREALERGEASERESRAAGALRLVGSGRGWLGQRVEIVDPEGLRPCAPGRVGEVWVTGPSVARGYWRRPAETAEVFVPSPDGDGSARLRTGDLGVILDGQLFITGRLKDLIIIRGRNLYPQDLELTAERAHPALEPAAGAAFSIESEDGERLVLVHELRRGERAGADEVAEAVRQAVASEFEVALADFVLLKPGALPRTTSGKVRRGRCRDLYLEGGLGAYGPARAAAPEPPVETALTLLSREQLALLDSSEAAAAAEEFVRASVSLKLLLPASRIAADAPLAALGLDSLRGLELAHELETRFGCDVPLQTLLEHETVATLAHRLVECARAPRDEEEATPDGSAAAGEAQLSPNQRALHLLEGLSQGESPNNLFAAGLIEGPLDVAALKRAALSLSARHAGLRTTFTAEPEVVPVVHQHLPPDFEEWDIAAQDAGRVAQLLEDEAHRPFDLSAGPLLRLRACRLPEGRTALLLVTHHLVSDLWSVEVLLKELGRLYGQEAAGVPAGLGPAPAVYAEFVARQSAMLSGTEGAIHREFWRRELRGLPTLDLATDRPRPAAQTFCGAVRTLTLPPETVEAAKALARGKGVTLYTLLLTALQCVLSRYTGQDNLVVGSPSSGRADARFAGTVGCFINPLPMRADFSDEPSFEQFLARNRAAVLRAFAHAEFPSGLMAAEAGASFDPSRPPLYQAFFVFEQSHLPGFEALPAFALGLPGARLRLGPLEVTSLELKRRTAQFDLLLYAAEAGPELRLMVEYNADLFEAATADRFLKSFRTLLESALREPGRPVHSLDILDPSERETQLEVWNRPAVVGVRPGRLLHEIFEERAAASPDATAVVDGLDEMSYRELDGRADALARLLRRRGVCAETPVALFFKPGAQLVTAVLAVLKAGGAYVPLDPEQPAERLRHIVEDSVASAGLNIVLTHRRARDRAAALADSFSLQLIDCEDAGDRAGDAAHPVARHAAAHTDALAYVIYTSGSTGRPKGVMVSHANVVRLFEETEPEFRPAPSDVWTMFHSYSFDFSVWEIWGALLYGGRLVIVPFEASRAPRRFYELLRTEGVTVLSQTPSAFRQLTELEEPWGEPHGFRLRAVVFGGEALDPRPLGPWLARYEGNAPQLVNMYGITETTVHVTYRLIGPADTEAGAVSPIGAPIRDLRVYLLDARQQLLPAGAVGEIHVGGPGLARGYLGRPDLTAERFVPDNFGGVPGARLYRSGDLARYTPGGDLEYRGRIDHQVKVRGHRIELGEIEQVLGAHPSVRQALVLARQDKYGDTQLLAYFAARDAAPPAEQELRNYLGERLPSYMMPAAFVTLKFFPLTPNGKIDRRALPPPEAARRSEGGRAQLAGTQAALAAIWVELLGAVEPSQDDRFFDLGGHSLLATRMVNRVREVLGVKLPIAAVFGNPTLAELASSVDAYRRGGSPPPRIPTGGELGDAPLSFAQERIWLAEQFMPGTPLFNIPIALEIVGPLQPPLVERCFHEIAARHTVLRTTYGLRDGAPRQGVSERATFGVPVIDFVGDAGTGVAAYMDREAGVPFDLSRGPLLRLRLLRLEADRHILFLVLHHIQTDLWSAGILLEEFLRGYAALREGREPGLQPPPVQYADFARWERGLRADGHLDAQVSFWKKRLAGADLLFEIPTDRPRSATPSVRGRVIRERLPRELAEALHTMRRQEGVTLYVLMLAAFKTLLWRYSGRTDILVGSDVAVREAPELQRLIGLLVNQVFLRTELAGAATFEEVLHRVRDSVLHALANRSVPLQVLAEELQVPRGHGAASLFRILFDLQAYQLPEADGTGFRLLRRDVDWATAKYDLSLFVEEEAGGLRATLEYNTDLFDESSARRLLAHYELVLDWTARNPRRPLTELVLLDERAQREAAATFNERLE